MVCVHLQRCREGGRSQERVAASMTVRGMETENRRSEKARLEIRRFLGVRSSGRHTATITARLPGTAHRSSCKNTKIFPQVSWHYVMFCL